MKTSTCSAWAVDGGAGSRAVASTLMGMRSFLRCGRAVVNAASTAYSNSSTCVSVGTSAPTPSGAVACRALQGARQPYDGWPADEAPEAGSAMGE